MRDNERARFLRIRKGDEEKQIIVDFFNGNKRSSIMFTLTVKIGRPGFHNCEECVYYDSDTKCRGMCMALEVTDQIREFIERELGLNPPQYYLTPIKKNNYETIPEDNDSW